MCLVTIDTSLRRFALLYPLNLGGSVARGQPHWPLLCRAGECASRQKLYAEPLPCNRVDSGCEGDTGSYAMVLDRGMLALSAYRFDVSDLFGSERESFRFEVVLHVLRIGRACERQHPDLHGEAEDHLGNPCREASRDVSNLGIAPDLTVGSQ